MGILDDKNLSDEQKVQELKKRLNKNIEYLNKVGFKVDLKGIDIDQRIRRQVEEAKVASEIKERMARKREALAEAEKGLELANINPPFARTKVYFVDESGTPEAKAKNIEFVKKIHEQGPAGDKFRTEYLNKLAKDTLRVNVDLLQDEKVSKLDKLKYISENIELMRIMERAIPDPYMQINPQYKDVFKKHDSNAQALGGLMRSIVDGSMDEYGITLPVEKFGMAAYDEFTKVKSTTIENTILNQLNEDPEFQLSEIEKKNNENKGMVFKRVITQKLQNKMMEEMLGTEKITQVKIDLNDDIVQYVEPVVEKNQTANKPEPKAPKVDITEPKAPKKDIEDIKISQDEKDPKVEDLKRQLKKNIKYMKKLGIKVDLKGETPDQRVERLHAQSSGAEKIKRILDKKSDVAAEIKRELNLDKEYPYIDRTVFYFMDTSGTEEAKKKNVEFIKKIYDKTPEGEKARIEYVNNTLKDIATKDFSVLTDKNSTLLQKLTFIENNIELLRIFDTSYDVQKLDINPKYENTYKALKQNAETIGAIMTSVTNYSVDDRTIVFPVDSTDEEGINIAVSANVKNADKKIGKELQNDKDFQPDPQNTKIGNTPAAVFCIKLANATNAMLFRGHSVDSQLNKIDTKIAEDIVLGVLPTAPKQEVQEAPKQVIIAPEDKALMEGYRENLKKNVAEIQKAIPTFSMDDKQIEEYINEKYESYKLAKELNDRYEKQNNIVKSICNKFNIKGANSTFFARTMYAYMDVSGTPEAEAKNEHFVKMVYDDSVAGLEFRRNVLNDLIKEYANKDYSFINNMTNTDLMKQAQNDEKLMILWDSNSWPNFEAGITCDPQYKDIFKARCLDLQTIGKRFLDVTNSVKEKVFIYPFDVLSENELVTLTSVQGIDKKLKDEASIGLAEKMAKQEKIKPFDVQIPEDVMKNSLPTIEQFKTDLKEIQTLLHDKNLESIQGVDTTNLRNDVDSLIEKILNTDYKNPATNSDKFIQECSGLWEKIHADRRGVERQKTTTKNTDKLISDIVDRVVQIGGSNAIKAQAERIFKAGQKDIFAAEDRALMEGYKDQLKKNIGVIKKIFPEFNMTEQQIDAHIADRYEKYKIAKPIYDRYENKRRIASETMAKLGLKGDVPFFSRVWPEYIDDSGTPEANQKNEYFFKMVYSRTEEGLEFRRNLYNEMAKQVANGDFHEIFDPNATEIDLMNHYKDHMDESRLWSNVWADGEDAIKLDPQSKEIREKLKNRSQAIGGKGISAVKKGVSKNSFIYPFDVLSEDQRQIIKTAAYGVDLAKYGLNKDEISNLTDASSDVLSNNMLMQKKDVEIKEKVDGDLYKNTLIPVNEVNARLQKLQSLLNDEQYKKINNKDFNDLKKNAEKLISNLNKSKTSFVKMSIDDFTKETDNLMKATIKAYTSLRQHDHSELAQKFVQEAGNYMNISAFDIQVNRIASANQKELSNQPDASAKILKDLQSYTKALNDTDAAYVWTNHQEFKDLKAAMSDMGNMIKTGSYSKDEKKFHEALTDLKDKAQKYEKHVGIEGKNARQKARLQLAKEIAFTVDLVNELDKANPAAVKEQAKEAPKPEPKVVAGANGEPNYQVYGDKVVNRVNDAAKKAELLSKIDPKGLKNVIDFLKKIPQDFQEVTAYCQENRTSDLVNNPSSAIRHKLDNLMIYEQLRENINSMYGGKKFRDYESPTFNMLRKGDMKRLYHYTEVKHEKFIQELKSAEGNEKLKGFIDQSGKEFMDDLKAELKGKAVAENNKKDLQRQNAMEHENDVKKVHTVQNPVGMGLGGM